MSVRWSGPFVAAFAVVFALPILPASAGCVGKNGDSRSGVRDRHTIAARHIDNKPFVRLSRGAATVQVDVRGAIGRCAARNEKLSFQIYSKRPRKEYVSCLSPSRKGPSGFLSCWFRSQKSAITTYVVQVANEGPCKLKYDLICWNGKRSP